MKYKVRLMKDDTWEIVEIRNADSTYRDTKEISVRDIGRL